MESKTTIDVRTVIEQSPLLKSVIELWRPNADRLGLMPEGAFQDHARRGWILAACSGTQLCGYVMFRRSRDRAAIVHLCVSAAFRGNGIARILVGEVSKRTSDCSGIVLKCRREYEASKLWPKLKFVPITECVGRSKSGAPLTVWWLDHGHENLLSVPKTSTCVRAVVDANIFVHLRDQVNDESLALQEDWLVGLVELCLTDEIFTEINRQDDEAKRKSSRAFAQSFQILNSKPGGFDAVVARLRPILRDYGCASDESDFRQVAKTIACQISVFVTHDQRLLNHAEAIYDEFALRIMRPGGLITELDILRREEEYRPAWLAGTRFSIQRTTAFDLSPFVSAFQNDSAGETKSGFSQQLSGMLARPEQFEVQLASSPDGEPIGCVAYELLPPGELRVPLLRIKRNPRSPTLSRHFLFEIVKHSVAHGRSLTRITDPYLQIDALNAVRQEFFESDVHEWIRTNPSGVGTVDDLRNLIRQIVQAHNLSKTIETLFLEKLSNSSILSDPARILSVEQLFWPYKIVDSAIPCFIMPIRPEWAKHMFDHGLADDLLGADDQVALNREFVYYRACQPRMPTAPARVLWYVSKDVGFLKAASLITDMKVGAAKDLFREFRRFGVYIRNNVLELAKGDMQNDIMAITFTCTELLKHPVSYSELIATLRAADTKTQLQSPVEITQETFFKLYCGAKNAK